MLSTGTGFCILNDMAVTAKCLLQQGAVQRVMTVDLDVHQVRTLPSPVWNCRMTCCLDVYLKRARSCIDTGGAAVQRQCLLTSQACWACFCSLCMQCIFSAAAPNAVGYQCLATHLCRP